MKTLKKYHGVVVPMVSPVTPDGKADVEAVEKLINNMAQFGVAPLIMGTNGEGNSVPVKEGARMIAAAKKAAAGRVLIYAGLGGLCISEQNEAAKLYEEAGADVIAATLPSYYALTPEQMVEYYTNLADVLNIPLMLYNITITTHMSIPMDVISKLSNHPNIVGLKDSENNIPRLLEACELFADREDFAYFCGCAANSAIALKNGADGIVPSGGNFIPKMYQDLYEAGVRGDEAEAERLQQRTIEIGNINGGKGLTLGQSIAGLKLICSMAGLCTPLMWPPLTELEGDIKEEIMKEAEPVLANEK